jgi:hypothetical protein
MMQENSENWGNQVFGRSDFMHVKVGHPIEHTVKYSHKQVALTIFDIHDF